MKRTPLSGGRIRLELPYRRADGKPTWARKIIAPINQRDQIKLEADFVRAVESRSLTVSYGDISRRYRRDNGMMGMDSTFMIVEKALNDAPANEDFVRRYDEYIDRLENGTSKRTNRRLAAQSVCNHKRIIRAVLRYAVKKPRQWIAELPIEDYGIKKHIPRGRILSEEEEMKLLTTLRNEKSYLYSAVRFSLRNPIRAEDLFSLTRAHLNLQEGYVRIRQGKTDAFSFLMVWDDYLWGYFRSLSAECEYLFPHKVRGEYCKVGSYSTYRTHWSTMLRKAEIVDFHFHDLRCCAGTYLLHNFAETWLQDAGLWSTVEMMRRVYFARNPWRAIKEYRASLEISSSTLCSNESNVVPFITQVKTMV